MQSVTDGLWTGLVTVNCGLVTSNCKMGSLKVVDWTVTLSVLTVETVFTFGSHFC